MKLAHLIACAIVALPLSAMANDTPAPASVETAAEAASTLFPGTLDMPLAEGASVPADCAFPETLTGSDVDLACIVADASLAEDVGVEYIAWLGAHGFRYSANVIGGFAAARPTDNGCEQVLRVYPHGHDDEAGGIWFALDRQPRCGAQTETP